MRTGTFYRVHCGDESPETVLDPRRPDGWVASDEDAETQPYGVSACMSLDDLRRYIRYYTTGDDARRPRRRKV